MEKFISSIVLFFALFFTFKFIVKLSESISLKKHNNFTDLALIVSSFWALWVAWFF
jgi:hypothetical protein